MANHPKPKNLDDVLLIEVSAGWTKQKGILLAGTKYLLGQVLAKVAGKYQVLDPAGEAAAKKAVAVLAEDVDAIDGDRPGVLIARGAVVDPNELVWPAGFTDAPKATALGELDALGIVARAAL